MKANNNLFSHNLLAKNISNIFLKYTKDNSFVIAIDGVWGSGKTHLMNNVLDVLDDKSFIKVKFNAWRYSKKEEIWRSLLICILDACRLYINEPENINFLGWDNSDKEIVLELLDDTERALYTAFVKEVPGEICIDTGNLLKTGLNMALKFVPWGNFGNEILNKLLVKQDDQGNRIPSKIEEGDIEKICGIFSRSSAKYSIERITGVEQFVKAFENLIAAILSGNVKYLSDNYNLTKHNKNIKLIVAIDDLDRCLPENSLEILEAIKLFVDFPGTFFMLAMDGNIIQQGLKIRYNEYDSISIRAKDYYEKTIDLSFRMPALLYDNFHQYIRNQTQYAESYINMFGLLDLALKSNLRSWERYIYMTDFNRAIINSIAGSDVFKTQEIVDIFLKIQCFSYQWPELYNKVKDFSTYISFEKAVQEMPYNCINKSNVEVTKKIVDDEIMNSIIDSKIIDFVSSAPYVADLECKEILELFFTFDKKI